MAKETVAFKVEPDEKAALELAAAARGLTPSAFAREAVRRLMADETIESPPLEEEKPRGKRPPTPEEPAAASTPFEPAPGAAPLVHPNGHVIVRIKAIPVPEGAGWLLRRWIALRLECRKARAFMVTHFDHVTGFGG